MTIKFPDKDSIVVKEVDLAYAGIFNLTMQIDEFNLERFPYLGNPNDEQMAVVAKSISVLRVDGRQEPFELQWANRILNKMISKGKINIEVESVLTSDKSEYSLEDK